MIWGSWCASKLAICLLIVFTFLDVGLLYSSWLSWVQSSRFLHYCFSLRHGVGFEQFWVFKHFATSFHSGVWQLLLDDDDDVHFVYSKNMSHSYTCCFAIGRKRFCQPSGLVGLPSVVLPAFGSGRTQGVQVLIVFHVEGFWLGSSLGPQGQWCPCRMMMLVAWTCLRSRCSWGQSQSGWSSHHLRFLD